MSLLFKLGCFSSLFMSSFALLRANQSTAIVAHKSIELGELSFDDMMYAQ
jgi:hypothetical protein